MSTKGKSLAQRTATPNQRRGSANSRGYTWRYFKLRRHYLQCHPICEVCGDELSLEVDHRTPIAKGGGAEDVANFRAVGRKCHDLLSDNLRRTGRNELPIPA